jgi:hypothetical protein
VFFDQLRRFGSGVIPERRVTVHFIFAYVRFSFAFIIAKKKGQPMSFKNIFGE